MGGTHEIEIQENNDAATRDNRRCANLRLNSGGIVSLDVVMAVAAGIPQSVHVYGARYSWAIS